jgi:hypothetical protein
MDTRPVGLSTSPRPGAQTAPAPPEPATTIHDEVRIDDPLQTSWGFGERENLYNRQIEDAIAAKWGGPPPLPAIILKSQVAQESGFDPKAVSRSGYVGLLQLGAEEAKAQGLKLEPVDERTLPEKNLPAGVAVLGIKHGVIRQPTALWDTDFAHKVADYYDKNGMPSDRQIWYLSLAAYNGGGGTVLKAMAAAIDRKLDPREWSNLSGPAADYKKSPLYAAVKDTYPQSVWTSKFREMANYPVAILRRANAE